MRISPTLCAVAPLCLLTVTSVAWAQPAAPDCPPGSWFCDEKPEQSEPPPTLPPPSPTPPPSKPPSGGTTVVVPGAQPSPPVVVYQQTPPPPPATVVVVRRPHPYVASPPPPPKKRRHRIRKWGFNTRLVGVMMDDQQHERAGMGGLGLSLRLRPQRYFAVDVGLDMIGGNDYQGNQRSEVPFSVSAMLYANPRDATQFYMLAGIGWSHARVEFDDRYTTQDYDYFGGHMGAGLEFRLSPPLALNVDLLGFVRGRTDRLAETEPEFTDPETGQTTNTSGGGLLRAGLTFYW